MGNLRQPNHLASLLVWSVIALVPLVEWRLIPRWLGLAIGRCAGAFGLAIAGAVICAIVAAYGAIPHGDPSADAAYRSVRAAVLDLCYQRRP